MKPNHRKYERKIPDQLVFCQVDGDEGGQVLNISEGGLCVEMFGLVQPEDLLHFWFSLDLKRRIEASAKLAWVDETGKVAGLNFVNLSVHARERIRAWMSQGAGKANGEGAAVTAAASTGALAGVSAQREGVKGPARRKWPLELVSKTPLLQFADFAESGSEETATPEFSRASGLVPVERYRMATRGQFLRGVLVGIVISAIVAIPVFKYSKNAKQSGNAAQGAPTEVAPANSGAQSGTTVPVATSEIKRSSYVPPATRKSERSTGLGLSSYPAQSPFGSTLTRQRLQTQGTHEGSPAVPPAQAVGETAKGAKKVAATPQQLWSSVQAGSSKAAVALADLYIRGDGVPMNCDQARVLLLVASQKKNAEAIKKLQDLDKTGCPTDLH